MSQETQTLPETPFIYLKQSDMEHDEGLLELIREIEKDNHTVAFFDVNEEEHINHFTAVFEWDDECELVRMEDSNKGLFVLNNNTKDVHFVRYFDGCYDYTVAVGFSINHSTLLRTKMKENTIYWYDYNAENDCMKCRLIPYMEKIQAPWSVSLIEIKTKNGMKYKPPPGVPLKGYNKKGYIQNKIQEPEKEQREQWVKETKATKEYFINNFMDEHFDCDDYYLDTKKFWILLVYLNSHNEEYNWDNVNTHLTVIDVDTDKQDYFKKFKEGDDALPFTYSSSKGFPHFYFVNDEHLQSSAQAFYKMNEKVAPPMSKDDDGGEILNNWVYERISGGFVYNVDKSIHIKSNPIPALLRDNASYGKEHKKKEFVKPDTFIPNNTEQVKLEIFENEEKIEDTDVDETKDSDVVPNETKLIVDVKGRIVDRHDYKAIEYNLDTLFKSTMKDKEGYNDSAQMIFNGASTGDKKILAIYHKVCKKHCKWYKKNGKEWVNEQWNNYNKFTKGKKKTCVFHWYKKFRTPELFDFPVAEIFLRIYHNIFFHNTQDREFYVFNRRTKLYSCDTAVVKGKFFHLLQKEFVVLMLNFVKNETYTKKYLNERIKTAVGELRKTLFKTDRDGNLTLSIEEQMSIMTEHIKVQKTQYFKKLQNKETANTIWSEVTTLLPAGDLNTINVAMNYNEEEKSYFHFANGYYDFDKDEFFPRTPKNFTTISLDYDWKKKDKNIQKKVDEIMEDLRKIHPNEEVREMYLRWEGYCLTGHTLEEKMLYNIGETAGNGKSTLTEIGNKCFDVYWTNVDSKAFQEGRGNNADKTFSNLLANPRRKLTMEETKWGNDFDVNLWKSHISGNSITVKPLYQAEKIIPQIFYKLETNSNYKFNANKLDEGVKRRGILIEFQSQFKKNPKEVDEENHIYLARKDMITRFKDDDYKLAYFYVLKDYAVTYCKEKTLAIPAEIEKAFTKTNILKIQEIIYDVFEVDINMNQAYNELLKKSRDTKLSVEEKKDYDEFKKELKQFNETYDDLKNFFKTTGIASVSYENDVWDEIKEMGDDKQGEKLKFNTEEQCIEFIMERCFFDLEFNKKKSTDKYDFGSYKKIELPLIQKKQGAMVMVDTTQRKTIRKYLGIRFKNKRLSTIKYAMIYITNKDTIDDLFIKLEDEYNKNDKFTKEMYEECLKEDEDRWEKYKKENNIKDEVEEES